MIMSMFKVLAVSNRKLCGIDFLKQMEKIARAKPAGIILREKDLTEEAYKRLAWSVMQICQIHGVSCILHTFADIARELGGGAIHLPLSVLRKEAGNLHEFEKVGVSIHSADEAMEAEKLGASYITAGHIFATDCKEGLAPRGLPFLVSVSNTVRIPVYAIGGITPENAHQAAKMGAQGACVMSGFMKCEDPLQYMKSFRINV